MIYLIRTYGNEGKSALKVGFANDLNTRMSQYFYMNPFFEIISSREGDELLEKLLHYYLYYKGFQYKINGKLNEWFLDDPEVIKIFDIPIEDLEKELWENRDKVFDLSSKNKKFFDYKLFEHLYQKNKENFIGEKYIIDESKKVIETSAKDIDIIFWEIFYLKDSSKTKDNYVFIDPINEKIVSDFLDNHFYRTGRFEEQMKMYCEFCDLYKNNQDIMSSLDHKIKDSKYKGFYTFYGTQGCSAKNFKESDLIRGFKDNLQGDKLASLIYSNFKTGGRYTMKEVKQKLHEIYTLLGISKTAKATDLGNYFSLQRTRLTLPDKTVVNGFKLELL